MMNEKEINNCKKYFRGDWLKNVLSCNGQESEKTKFDEIIYISNNNFNKHYITDKFDNMYNVMMKNFNSTFIFIDDEWSIKDFRRLENKNSTIIINRANLKNLLYANAYLSMDLPKDKNILSLNRALLKYISSEMESADISGLLCVELDDIKDSFIGKRIVNDIVENDKFYKIDLNKTERNLIIKSYDLIKEWM